MRLSRASALLLLGLCTACSPDARAPSPDPQAPRVALESARLAAALPAYIAALETQPAAPRHTEIRNWIASGQSDRAVDALSALLEQAEDGEAAFLMGWTLYGQTRYAQALPHLRSAVAAGPGYPQAERVFFLLGRSLQERGDLAGAQAAYEADVRLIPDQGQGHFRLAQLELEAGELDACESRARLALERFIRPRDKAKTHALLADVAEARDDLQAARAELEHCVQLFPHYEAFYKLSRLCDQLGDQPAAERYLREHQLWRTRAGR